MQQVVRLTAYIPLPADPAVNALFAKYRKLVNFALNRAMEEKVTSHQKIRKLIYQEAKKMFPKLPTHYIYTACQVSAWIFKSWRKKRRRGIATKNPHFKKNAILLDANLFLFKWDGFQIRISTPEGRKRFVFTPTKHLLKFKGWKVKQSWLKEREGRIYFYAIFEKEVALIQPEGLLSVDLNEDNISIYTGKEVIKLITHEKDIHTGMWKKRRAVQKRLKTGKQREKLLEKYGKREKHRIEDLLHKVANWVVEKATHIKGAIALEDLTHLKDRVKMGKKMNGRLHRWAVGKLQSFIEYKAKLKGLPVIYINPSHTSSLCPVCGGKLAQIGYREKKCRHCGLTFDRDYVAALNIRDKALEMWGASVPPESQSMKLPPLEVMEVGSEVKQVIQYVS